MAESMDYGRQRVQTAQDRLAAWNKDQAAQAPQQGGGIRPGGRADMNRLQAAKMQQDMRLTAEAADTTRKNISELPPATQKAIDFIATDNPAAFLQGVQGVLKMITANEMSLAQQILNQKFQAAGLSEEKKIAYQAMVDAKWAELSGLPASPLPIRQEGQKYRPEQFGALLVPSEAPPVVNGRARRYGMGYGQ
jgi:hypothetical protein